MAEHEHIGDCLTLDRAYQWFNERLFDNSLPPALMVVISMLCCGPGEIVVANKVFDGPNMIGQLLGKG
jgi:hypothetical protein